LSEIPLRVTAARLTGEHWGTEVSDVLGKGEKT
jgi:hypothetical protein